MDKKISYIVIIQSKKTFRYTPKDPIVHVVRERGLEPPHLAAPDPKSGASAIPPFPLMKLMVAHPRLERGTP